MTAPVAEVALAAIQARLAAIIPTAAVERARRAPVDLDLETLPRLVIQVEGLEADNTAEPGSTHYTIGVIVVGYAAAASDLTTQQAVLSLHASVVAALVGWTPTTAGLGDVMENGADFSLHDTEQSSAPSGEFSARFEILAVAPAGSPYL